MPHYRLLIYVGALLLVIGLLLFKGTGTETLGWIVASGGVLMVFLGAVAAMLLRPSGIYVDPDDPLWQQATRLAQESIPTLRALASEHREGVLVKFSLETAPGKAELVWGELLDLTETDLRATIESWPLVSGATHPSDQVIVPLSELLDWGFQQPDGKIRGSFTAQAELRIAQREGRSIPRHLRTPGSQFVDPL